MQNFESRNYCERIPEFPRVPRGPTHGEFGKSDTSHDLHDVNTRTQQFSAFGTFVAFVACFAGLATDFFTELSTRVTGVCSGCAAGDLHGEGEALHRRRDHAYQKLVRPTPRGCVPGSLSIPDIPPGDPALRAPRPTRGAHKQKQW